MSFTEGGRVSVVLDARGGGLLRILHWGVAAAIAVHKRLRALLHSSTVVRADHPDPAARVHGVVAADRAAAVFAYVQRTTSVAELPARRGCPASISCAPTRCGRSTSEARR